MELATDLSKMVGDTVEADNTRLKIEELQAKLGDKPGLLMAFCGFHPKGEGIVGDPLAADC